MFECYQCCAVEPTDEIDYHESLRLYAALNIVPEVPMEPSPSEGKIMKINDDTEFVDHFRNVLKRSGWPMKQCDDGKAYMRCFVLDDSGQLTWGSHLPNGKLFSMPLSEIKSITRQDFGAGVAPSGSDVSCMVVFVDSDDEGLFVLCSSEIDAAVLQHGFRGLLAGSA